MAAVANALGGAHIVNRARATTSRALSWGQDEPPEASSGTGSGPAESP